MEAAEAAKFIKLMGSDLLTVLRRHDVGEATITLLSKNKITTVRRFQMVGSTEDGVRATLVLYATKSDNLEDMAEIAGILPAWAELRAFQGADDSVRAEQRLMGQSIKMKAFQYTQSKMV